VQVDRMVRLPALCTLWLYLPVGYFIGILVPRNTLRRFYKYLASQG